jgi:hypothetical protein
MLPLSSFGQINECKNVYVWDFKTKLGTNDNITRTLTDEVEDILTSLNCVVLQRRNYANLQRHAENEKVILSIEGFSDSTTHMLKTIQAQKVIFGEVDQDFDFNISLRLRIEDLYTKQIKSKTIIINGENITDNKKRIGLLEKSLINLITNDANSYIYKESMKINTDYNLSTVLFTEDFESNKLEKSWQIVSGKWFVKDGELHGIGTHYNPTREWGIITLNKQIPSEVIISLNICIKEGALGELMFHLSENKYVRVYLYEIDQEITLGNGTFIENNQPGSIGLDEVIESLGGGETIKNHSYPVKLGQWYSLSVKYEKGEYTIMAGGQTLIKYKDAVGRLQSDGTIGLIANGHICFDDIVISKVAKE